MRAQIVAAALAALLPLTAAADEVWTSDMGKIIYDSEVGDAAIFTFTNVDAYPATLVIPGLAGNYSDRGVHEAYWVGEGAGDCAGFRAAPNGTGSAQWGRALVAFDKPAFPTSFTLLLGFCLDPYVTSIRAETTAN